MSIRDERMLTEVVVDVSFGVSVDTACKVKHHSTLLYLCFCIRRAVIAPHNHDSVQE